MKKFLSLLMALAMLLGCAAFAEEVDYTGTWVLTGAESQGIEMGVNTIELMGMSMTMELAADGTCVLVAMGVSENGTWKKEEGGVSITDAAGVTDIAKYENDMLVLEQGSDRLMLTREGAAPAIEDKAAAVAQANVPAEQFEGAWLLTRANLMGVDIPADAMGVYMAFVLDNGVGVYATTDEAGELAQVAVNYEVREDEAIGTVLELSVTDATTGEKAVVMQLNMSADGELFMEAEGVVMFFTLQVEEAAE